MKPVDFTLHQPASLDEALGLLARSGDEGKVLAGGQSLVPLLNFRLARPEHVIDIGRIPALDEIRVEPDVGWVEPDTGWVGLGAMVRQAAVERSAAVASACPLLAAALPHIAHPPIRSRGTVCGSLAHADPAAELPAVALALDAVFVAVSVTGQREIPAAEFFQGYLTTALGPDEILVAVRFPVAARNTGAAFCEVARRAGDFALAGVAAQVTVSAGVITNARIAVSGVASTPFRATPAEEILRGQPVPSDAFVPSGTPAVAVVARAADAAAAAVSPPSDLHASAGYRRHLTGILIRRAVTQALRQTASR